MTSSFRQRSAVLSSLPLPALPALCLVLLIGCGDSSPTDSGATVAAIAVAPQNATLVVGETQQFNATITDQDGAVVTGHTVTWSSSDDAVVTVGDSGLGTGVGAGTATITGAIGTVSGSSALTVNAVSAWSSLGAGLDNSVNALIVHADALIAGGTFNNAGGQEARRIARWNGTDWQPMGAGLTGGAVEALAVHNSDLIAAGTFGQGQEAKGVARWDGANWQPIGPGLSPVRALAVYDGDLLAAGLPLDSGLDPEIQRLQRWDGTQWQPMGSGTNDGGILVFAIYDGDLIAGGTFTVIGGQAANYIARWDGSQWHALGVGSNGHVMSLAVHDGDLVVGGMFTQAGGQTANRIARWTGSEWQGMGGLNHVVYDLVNHDSDVIAVGAFTGSATRVARWDGTAWQPIGGGVGWWATSAAVYGGDLIVGGTFTEASGEPANRVARWGTQ